MRGLATADRTGSTGVGIHCTTLSYILYDQRFTISPDDKPHSGSKNGILHYSANRGQRWDIMMLGYEFTNEYKRTSNFGQANELSQSILSKKR